MEKHFCIILHVQFETWDELFIKKKAHPEIKIQMQSITCGQEAISSMNSTINKIN